MDGFDEINPSYKQTVIDLVQGLRQTAVEQLWVTTRPHLREELEDKLQHLSYTLEPFSEKDQVQFLTKFWSLKDWLSKLVKLEIFTTKLIKKLAKSISDKDGELTGITLQTRILAEAFEKEVKIFCQLAASVPELPFQLDLIELYGRFIERKYDIYHLEKRKVQVNNLVAVEQKERELRHMTKDHQLLALKLLFAEEQVALFQKNRECSFSTEQLTRIGIVQVRDDGKPHVIDHTFAEYYAADCLGNCL